LLISFPNYLNLFASKNNILASYLAVSIIFLLFPLLYHGEFLNNVSNS
jgi:hypothetical protein